MFSDYLKSSSATLFALSKLSLALDSLDSLSFSAWNFFFAASNLYILFSSSLFILDTLILLFANSDAKADN
jgi:hypothetical protein